MEKLPGGSAAGSFSVFLLRQRKGAPTLYGGRSRQAVCAVRGGNRRGGGFCGQQKNEGGHYLNGKKSGLCETEGRSEKSISLPLFYQAIFIESAILEDRCRSALSHTKINTENKQFRQLLNMLKSRPEFVQPIARKKIPI